MHQDVLILGIMHKILCSMISSQSVCAPINQLYEGQEAEANAQS